MQDNLINFLKNGSFNVPLYLIKYKNKLNIDDSEILILSYLLSHGNNFIFNPEDISNDFCLKPMEVMTIISNMSDKNLLNIESKRKDKVLEEYINMDSFYRSISNILIEELNKKDNIDIYSEVESSFGRSLSPIEIEVIKSRIDSGTNIEIFREALREAAINNVNNLRYIDKILYEWEKKGLDSVEKIHDYQNKWREEKKNNKKRATSEDIFEFDWLDNNEE